MLNPNRADHERDDPTIHRCIGFARSWGYSRLEVVNLFAFCAKEPRSLVLAVDSKRKTRNRKASCAANESLTAHESLLANKALLANQAVDSIVGEYNDFYIRAALSRFDLCVAAWGNYGSLWQRDLEVEKLVLSDVDIYCFARNEGGAPRHPLYIARNTKPRLYKAARSRAILVAPGEI